MTDLLDTLRDADPVDRTSLEVPRSLERRVADTPHRGRPPGHRRTLLAAAALACCLIATVALVPLGDDGRDRLSLADKAYAATSGPGVRHWRISIRTYIDGVRRGPVQREEGWARADVLHVLLFDGHRLTSDIRETPAKTRSWGAGMNDYTETPAPRHRSRGPLQLGDPFADFRRAHDAGRLTRVNATTYRLRPDRSAFPPEATLTYELDPQTALPVRAVLAYTRAPGPFPSRYDGARYRSVFAYDVYERLPDTAASRAKLELLPHPGAGPSRTDAHSAFSILRDGARLTAEQQRRLDPFATAMSSQGRDFDVASARRGPHDVVLVAGAGYVAMMRRGGGTVANVDAAVRRGMAIGGSATGRSGAMYVVVADGVRAVRARRPHGRWRTFAVEQNVAVLPNSGYHFALVR